MREIFVKSLLCLPVLLQLRSAADTGRGKGRIMLRERERGDTLSRGKSSLAFHGRWPGPGSYDGSISSSPFHFLLIFLHLLQLTLR